MCKVNIDHTVVDYSELHNKLLTEYYPFKEGLVLNIYVSDEDQIYQVTHFNRSLHIFPIN